MSSRSIDLITSSTTITSSYDTYFIDASNGNITVTMHNINTDGENYIIKRLDSSTNTVILQGYDSSQTIDGNVTITISHGKSFMIMSHNSVWHTAL